MEKTHPLQSLRLVKKSGSDHLVIYVHGFTGGVDTFRNQQNEYLHHFLDAQIRSRCDFAAFDYHSRLFEIPWIKRVANHIPLLGDKVSPSANRRLDQCAKLLRTYYYALKAKYHTVNFICHSMGGIVVKHFLVSECELEAFTFPGFFITVATPHHGVSGASALAFLGNVHINELDPFSDRLAQLADRWPRITKRINARYYAAIDDAVVHERSSCSHNEKHKQVMIEGTHTTSCKPTTATCALIRDLNLIVPSFLRIETATPVQSRELKDYVLFQSYRHEFQPYYLLRQTDHAMTNALKLGHVWITGPCGCGKTVLVQRTLLEREGLFFYADVSPCCSQVNAHNYFCSIYDTIMTMCRTNGTVLSAEIPSRTSPEGVIQHISNVLSELSAQSPVTLFVDEVPMQQGPLFDEFCNLMVSLVNFHSNRLDGKAGLRIVVAAPGTPTKALSESFQGKFDSLFSPLNLQLWDDAEVGALLSLASESLALSFTNDDRTKLIAGARGTPRILKNTLRKYLELRRDGHSGISDAIQLANREDVS